MDGKTALTQAIKVAADAVGNVKDTDLHKSTPCTEWDLQALIRHIVYELLWVPDLLAGKTIAEVGDKYEGDILGGDYIAAWQGAADAVLAGLQTCDLASIVHLSYADKPAGEYLLEVAADMVVHGWDVAKSIGATYEVPDDLLQAVWGYLEPRIQGYRDVGATGPAVSVADGAPLLDQLIAMTGRQP